LLKENYSPSKLYPVMPIFAIFKTEKEEGKTEFIGQVSDPTVSKASEIARKSTGEKAKSVSVSGTEVFAASTESFNLDFVEKKATEDLILYQG